MMDIYYLIPVCIVCIAILILKVIPIMSRIYIIWNKIKHLPQDSFIGNSLITMSNAERINYFSLLIEKFRKGVVLIWIVTIPYIFIFSPKLVQIILNSTVHIEKGRLYKILKSIGGEGLITSSASQWHHDRKLIGSAFRILNEYVTITSQNSEILIKCIEKKLERNPERAIDVSSFISKAILDITCEILMGVKLHVQEIDTEITNAIHRLMHLTSERILRPWQWIDWLYFMTPTGRKYKSVLRILDKFMCELIIKKKAMRQSQNRTSRRNEDSMDIGALEKKCFLDMLLDENEKAENPLSDKQMKDQIYTFILAAVDTTSILINWMLIILGNYVEHQEKIHEELDEVFHNSKVPANISQLSELKYLERAIKETLRLYPSATLINRRLTEDVKIGDYTLPRDIEVVVPIIIIHRNPEVWSDPMKFNPDRFLPENSKGRHSYAYIPFSAGPRNCIGQKFALLEIKMILTAIMRRWKLKNVKPPEKIRRSLIFLYRPQEECLLYFTPKK